MSSFIVRRLLETIGVLIGVSVIVFVLVRLSGDPAALLLPLEATQAEYDALRERMGLNEPLPVQFFKFLGLAIQGDFGESVRGHQPALGLVFDRLGATTLLTLGALAFALLIAFPAGIIAATHRGTWLERGVMLFALAGQSTPVFWLGIMFILLFSVGLGWLPTGGMGGPAHFVLPIVTLGLFSAARTARLVRSGMLEALAEDYVRTARAKGLAYRRVVVKHALRNALIPIVTVIGLDFAALLGGAVVTETVFGWPGVGRLVVEAIGRRDYPVVQAAVVVIAVIYVGVNFLVDVLYVYLDPRMRIA